MRSKIACEERLSLRREMKMKEGTVNPVKIPCDTSSAVKAPSEGRCAILFCAQARRVPKMPFCVGSWLLKVSSLVPKKPSSSRKPYPSQASSYSSSLLTLIPEHDGQKANSQDFCPTLRYHWRDSWTAFHQFILRKLPSRPKGETSGGKIGTKKIIWLSYSCNAYKDDYKI